MSSVNELVERLRAYGATGRTYVPASGGLDLTPEQAATLAAHHVHLTVQLEQARKAGKRTEAAARLHQPIGHDKWGHVTVDLAIATVFRCGQCSMSVPERGCRTWETSGLTWKAPANA